MSGDTLAKAVQQAEVFAIAKIETVLVALGVTDTTTSRVADSRSYSGVQLQQSVTRRSVFIYTAREEGRQLVARER